MTIPQKLRLLQRLSGLSQTALAGEMGVSFVSLNRWIQGKAIPRKKMQERIDELYRRYAGLAIVPQELLETKKAALHARAKKAKNIIRTLMHYPDIRDQFVLVLTYTSNSIEGSTLTEAETSAVLFQNVALPDKTLVEQLEAKNHQAALLYLFTHLAEKKPITEELLLKLHGMLMNGIRQDAGFYRRHGVRIVGANVPTANYLKVPTLIETLVESLDHHAPDIIAHSAAIHAQFEQIHPFSDGNGRIGRLLMHAMLLQQNCPPSIIRPENKRLYYSFLITAQREGDISALQDFVCDGVLEGWEILTSPQGTPP